MKSRVFRRLWPAVVFIASMTVHAAQFGDFTYVSSGTEFIVTGYRGSGGDVAIPATIDGLPVTGIGRLAFYGFTGLTVTFFIF